MAYSHAEVSVAWMRYDGNRVSRSAGKCHWLNLHHPWEHQLAASECWHPTWHWHDKWHGPRYPTPATSCTESIDPEYLKPEIHPNGQRCDASRATFS